MVDVSLYGRVYPSVGGCVPVWEGVSHCGKVRPGVGWCPSVVGCSPMWEGVSQCRRVCPCMGACAPV